MSGIPIGVPPALVYTLPALVGAILVPLAGLPSGGYGPGWRRGGRRV